METLFGMFVVMIIYIFRLFYKKNIVIKIIEIQDFD